MRFVSYLECLCQIPGIYWTFFDFCILVQARPALRDLRYFFSTNNLRLVKNFLEIIKEALIAKIYKPWNHAFCLGFRVFVSNSRHILDVFLTFVFWSRQDLLCGISDIFSRQIIWGLLNFFLRSSRKISQQKCANHKIFHFVSYFHIFCQLYTHVERFLTFVIWY